MIATLKTALAFALAAATQLQNEQDNPRVTDAESWQDIADDLRKVADYAQSKANDLSLKEQIDFERNRDKHLDEEEKQ